MLPDGRLSIVLVRAIILLFRSIAPLSVVHATLSLTGLVPPFSLLGIRLRLELFTLPEALFYFIVYLPRSFYLQRPAPEGNSLSRDGRRELFEKCLQNVSDLPYFMQTWFKGASIEEIQRENLRQWLAWGLWNRYTTSQIDDEELNEYVEKIEKKLGRKLREGNVSHQPIRISVDHINIQHRPLFWYLIVGLVDTLLFVKMWRLKFQHFPVHQMMKSFPYRPSSFVSKEHSPAQDISYWYRPHKSKRNLPILYIHGIGIGLYTYTDIFAEVLSKSQKSSADKDVGIIAIEIMPISFRITSAILRRQQMVRQITEILRHHGWIDAEGKSHQKVVLAANSYGTIIATYLLHDQMVSSSIGPVMLIDPITVWVHMGDIAYNFTVKLPQTASEHQLHYFGCTDMGAAHAVTRSFVWTENVLWKDEIKGRKFVIVLSGKDIILDAERCRKYLLLDQDEIERSSIGNVRGAETIVAGDMEILWFKDLNHAEVFEKIKERKVVVDALWRLCMQS